MLKTVLRSALPLAASVEITRWQVRVSAPPAAAHAPRLFMARAGPETRELIRKSTPVMQHVTVLFEYATAEKNTPHEI
jgi:hypothetical protein